MPRMVLFIALHTMHHPVMSYIHMIPCGCHSWAVAPCKIYSLSKRLRLDCCMLQQHRQHVCEAALLQTTRQGAANVQHGNAQGSLHCSSALCQSCHAEGAHDGADFFSYIEIYNALTCCFAFTWYRYLWHHGMPYVHARTSEGRRPM